MKTGASAVLRPRPPDWHFRYVMNPLNYEFRSMQFKDIREYVAALRHNPELAVVTMQMAADFPCVSRAAIDRMVRVGYLEEIRINKTRVRPSSRAH